MNNPVVKVDERGSNSKSGGRCVLAQETKMIGRCGILEFSRFPKMLFKHAMGQTFPGVIGFLHVFNHRTEKYRRFNSESPHH